MTDDLFWDGITQSMQLHKALQPLGYQEAEEALVAAPDVPLPPRMIHRIVRSVRSHPGHRRPMTPTLRETVRGLIAKKTISEQISGVLLAMAG